MKRSPVEMASAERRPSVRSAPPAVGRDAGFALLIALVIAAVGLLATAALATELLSTTAIAGDDAAGGRAADAAQTAAADVVARLRWSWLPPAATVTSRADEVGLERGSAYRAVVERVEGPTPPLTSDSAIAADDPGIVRYRVTATGTWGHASRTTVLTAVAVPDGLPRGLVVRGDLVVEAPLSLQGCGAYAGGDVSGRELIGLTSPAGGLPGAAPDLAYGGLYEQAAVHARGRIYANGLEEHDAGTDPAGDTDRDSGVVPPVELIGGPGPAALGDLAAHASDTTAALTADGLDLSLLDPAAPSAVDAPVLPVGGRIYICTAGTQPLSLFGARPPAPGACAVTIVVLGDCVASGGPHGDQPPALTGCLIVTGTLSAAAPLTVTGGLSAGRLVVHSPLTLRFEPWSGQGSPPGALTIRTAQSSQ